jgi:signal transduction histidine kinase
MPASGKVDENVLERLEKQMELYVRALRNTTSELEGKIRELGILRQLGQLFERSTRLADVTSHALSIFLQSSMAENASIMLFSKQSSELNLLAAIGRSDAKAAFYGLDGYPDRLFSIGEGLAGCCLAEGTAILAADAQQDVRFRPGVGRISVGSLACLPLVVQENSVGVVNLSHPEPNSLDGQQLPVWSIVASYLAISVSHALLFQELRDSNRALEERVRDRTKSLEFANREVAEAKVQIDRQNATLQERVHERTKELEAALQEVQVQHARLEQANHVKDEFLNNINHELKTPLNAIIGYAGLLLKEAGETLPEEQRFDLELIEANGKHLQQILENIFSLKDIQDGTIELERTPTDLGEMVGSAVASVRPRALEKGISVAFEPLDVPPILVDPTLLRRVLFNLLDNAIKFSNQGQITVANYLAHRVRERPQVDCPPDQGGMPFAVVEVTDQGKGIDPEDFERIFQKFQQGEPPTRKSEGGSGIGLAIAKNLVELHGGRIWVTSRLLPHPGRLPLRVAS